METSDARYWDVIAKLKNLLDEIMEYGKLKEKSQLLLKRYLASNECIEIVKFP